MNRTDRNEESSLVANAAPMSANSRYVIEDLVTNTLENAPQMLDTPTSNRSGLRALLGGRGIRQQNITKRRQMFSSRTLPSPPSDGQRLRSQIETEAAEAEARAQRTTMLRLQIETRQSEPNWTQAPRRHLLLPVTKSASLLDESIIDIPTKSAPCSQLPRVQSPSTPLEVTIPLLLLFSNCSRHSSKLPATGSRPKQRR